MEHTFEYKMPKKFAEEILKTRKGEEKKMQPQQYLCKYINDTYGLKGRCTKVHFYDR